MTTLTWIAVNPGSWSTAANWSPAQTPGSTDTVLFDGSGNPFSVVGTATVAGLTMNDPNLILTETGPLSVTGDTVISSGTLSVSTGATATLNNLINQGRIVLESEATVVTTGTYDTASIQGISAPNPFQNVLRLKGTLDNTGSTLTVDGVPGFSISAEGTVVGGFVTGAFPRQEVNDPTWDGVTWIGPLNLSSHYKLANNFAIKTADGLSPGVLTMRESSGLLFRGDQIFDNARVDVLDPTIVGTVIEADGTLTLGPSLTVRGLADVAGRTTRLDLRGTGSGSTIVNQGSIDLLQQGPGGTAAAILETNISVAGFLNSGTISIRSTPGHGQLTVTSTNFTNTDAGTITTGGGGLFTVSQVATFTNDGTIIVNGGSIDFAPQILGSGDVIVRGFGTVDFHAGSGTGQTIAFDGFGALELESGFLFGGTITGLTQAGQIVLDMPATAIAYTDHQLTMRLTGGQTFNLTVLGDLTLADFIVNTGSASTTISTDLPAPCFALGTRIATETGDRAVEDLRVGDKVRVVPGSATREVVWIGYRHVDCLRHPTPLAVWPVRIAPGTFGPGLPSRALFLSPDHAVYFDDVLIPVKYLINGDTIARVQVDDVTYYHVELTSHDIVLAEGLPTESYLDAGDRNSFANGPDVIRLFATFGLGMEANLIHEAKGRAPLVVTGAAVEAARTTARRSVQGREDSRETATAKRSLAHPPSGRGAGEPHGVPYTQQG